MISSVAFLTVNDMTCPISSIDDLVNQDTIEYGTLKENSVTLSILESSHLLNHHKLLKHLQNGHNNLVDTEEEGIRRVREENYAFVTSTNLINYANNHMPCDTINVGEPLFFLNYAIAIPRNSPLREALSVAILELEEEGTLGSLRAKWFQANQGELNSTFSSTNSIVFHFLEECVNIQSPVSREPEISGHRSAP